METAHIVKAVLYKSFFMGFILLIIMSFAYHFYFDFFYNICQKFYGDLDRDTLINLIILVTGFWKLVLFQFFLFPALALHCTLSRCCKKEA